MSDETIRKSLVDAINEMTRLLEVCVDSNQEFALKIKIRELFQKLDRVIVTALNADTVEFEDALSALQALSIQAKEAKDDLEKVAKTLQKASDAVTKVEKLVIGVVGILAII